MLIEFRFGLENFYNNINSYHIRSQSYNNFVLNIRFRFKNLYIISGLIEKIIVPRSITIKHFITDFSNVQTSLQPITKSFL